MQTGAYQGAVTAVPQNAFASAQPVARAAVTVNAAANRCRADDCAMLRWLPHAQACLERRPRLRATWPRLRQRSRTGRSSPRKLRLRRRFLLPNSSRRWRLIQGNRCRRRKCRRCVQRQRLRGQLVKVAPPGKPATPTTGHPRSMLRDPGSPLRQPANRPGNQPAPKAACLPLQPSRIVQRRSQHPITIRRRTVLRKGRRILPQLSRTKLRSQIGLHPNSRQPNNRPETNRHRGPGSPSGGAAE